MKQLSLLTNMLKELRKGAKGARRLAKRRFPQAADRVGKRVQQVVVVFAVVLFDPVLDSSLDDFVNQQVKAAQMLFSTGIQGFFRDLKVCFKIMK